MILMRCIWDACFFFFFRHDYEALTNTSGWRISPSLSLSTITNFFSSLLSVRKKWPLMLHPTAVTSTSPPPPFSLHITTSQRSPQRCSFLDGEIPQRGKHLAATMTAFDSLVVQDRPSDAAYYP